MQRISVIVRFRNEATHLDAVLRAVRAQHCRVPVEVVGIDNSSSDESRSIAQRHADIVLDIAQYRPGAALNRAVESCSGDVIVILSAHAIPANRSWLENLTSWLSNTEVLGVYGAQLYPITSKFLDKRDLDIFSDLRPRTEVRDSDFWNANSAFLRSSWEKGPFDESVYELEDHYWTKTLLPEGGQWIRFEPTALVYHYGHEARNDRTFVEPSCLSDMERIDRAVDALTSDSRSWPAVMSAGLTLGSMSGIPEVVKSIPVLGGTLLGHEDFDVRWRMAAALGRIGTPAAAEFLVQGLADASFYARDECAWALARLGDDGASALLPVADALQPWVRPFAALALGLSGNAAGQRQGLRLLAESLAGGASTTIVDALYFLGEIAAAVPAAHELAGTVLEHLSGEDTVVRAAAWCAGALARDGAADETYCLRLVELARRHPLETVRAEAVVALARIAMASRAARPRQEVLRALHEDPVGRVRYVAMQSLRLMGDRGVDGWREAGRDDDFGVVFERDLLPAA